MRRLDSLLLAGAGMLLVHQVAYTASAVFGVESSVAHGHLAFAWFGGSLALLGALTRGVTQSLKRRNHDAGSVATLAATISLGYGSMEQLERLADGYAASELFYEPVFWLGLALAPLIAIVLHWSVRSAVEMVALFLSTPPAPNWVVPKSQRAVVFVGVRPVSAQLAAVVSRRGPPVQ